MSSRRLPALLLAGLALPLSVMAAPAGLTEAHELVIEELFAARSGRGYVTARACEACSTMRLVLTPQTRYFEGRREISARDSRAFRGRDAVISVDINTGKVVRVRATGGRS